MNRGRGVQPLNNTYPGFDTREALGNWTVAKLQDITDEFTVAMLERESFNNAQRLKEVYSMVADYNYNETHVTAANTSFQMIYYLVSSEM
ncbi:MAG: hypothetical protein P4M11_03625 [Candidatus Pacebacteria bacterium]|nr:hypothetical protein [Candidatus Paceibacterota bacterium]